MHGAGSKATFEFDIRNYIVTPGLIDIHTHIYPFSYFGLYADSDFFPLGITTVGDGGGCGTAGYEAARLSLSMYRERIKIFLHVASSGLATFDEDISPDKFAISQIEKLFEKYPKELVGLKIRMGKECTKGMGSAPLRAACELGARLGKKVMVHCSNAEISMDEMLVILNKNDVATHVYHGQGQHTLLENGFEAARKAQNRGVIMDTGDADGCHFSFEVFRKALEAGLFPDVISTDITAQTRYLHNSCGGHCLPAAIARMEVLGLSRMETLRATTVRAAEVLEISDETGSLTPGKCADIAVWREVPTQRTYTDFCGNEVTIHKILNPEMTIRGGEIVYRSLML